MIALCLALSHHLLEGNWNEVHPCVRMEVPVTESLNIGGGAFLNSEGNVSAFVGLSGGDRFWWEAGIATGYSGGDVVPFGRVGIDLDRYRLFLAPAYNVDSNEIGAVIGVEVDLLNIAP